MSKRHVIGSAVLAAAAIGLTACGSSSSGGNAGQAVSPTATSTATNQTAAGCSTPPALQTKHKSFSHEPPLTIAHTTYTARVATNCGTIVLALDGKNAPHTVNSFAFLSKQGYFTNTPCHRLTTAPAGIYVLQCGDPTGTGTGGPGYTIPDENLKGAKYPAGTVAMANTGQPHTGGSQFFFVYRNTPLPPHYTPFGHVTSGLDVLTRIANAGTDNSFGQGDGAPNQPVVIESFNVTKGAPA
jgi:peptidyl-prolyl cis-trans isomerase B (cyclophilin B)